MKHSRRTYREQESIEEDCRNVERLCQSPQTEMRRLEVIGGHRQAQKGDDPISSDGGHPASRNQRREGDLARQNRTQNGRAENIHDSNSIFGLAIRRHSANPAGQGEDAITSNGEYQSRRSDNRNAGGLPDVSVWNQ